MSLEEITNKIAEYTDKLISAKGAEKRRLKKAINELQQTANKLKKQTLADYGKTGFSDVGSTITNVSNNVAQVLSAREKTNQQESITSTNNKLADNQSARITNRANNPMFVYVGLAVLALFLIKKK